MAVVRFHLASTLTPSAVLDVLTDFSPARAQEWPTIDSDHFTVHRFGDSWAEVTEGTNAAWERGRYDWDRKKGRVTVSTLDSKLFGPGGGWVFQTTPEGKGTRIDIELTREPTAFKDKVLAAVLKPIAPSYLRKAFSGPLKAE
ncbi:hypothetical protein ACIOTI_41410 [Streptomyces sp. NPDC087843]|uniref:hypothetical protein n=1 Tax=Streptomyces sp. NPDC087843 TaxID=3365804 RepID=UPI0037F7323F